MRICAFGDSIMNGTGDPEALGWIGRIVQPVKRRDPEVTLYNLGVRRNTSADIRRRWRGELEARQCVGAEVRLFFSFGVNDSVWDADAGTQRVDPGETCAHAAAILSDATSIGPVLMLGPTPLGDEQANVRIASIDARLAETAGFAGTPYLSVFSDLRDVPAYMTEITEGDGAHPGAGGYSHLARLVAAWPAWRAWFP